MTRPHNYSKKARDERVPIIKRTREYIGPRRLLKLSKRKRIDIAKLPTKLIFNDKHKLERVFDIQEVPNDK